MAHLGDQNPDESASDFSATIEELVAVKTDPGYWPHRGWPGTGVATICGWRVVEGGTRLPPSYRERVAGPTVAA